MMEKKGLVAWMAQQPVRANLLMWILVILGAVAFSQMKKETFPAFSRAAVSVQIGYPGAAAETLESSVVLPVENALKDIDSITDISVQIGAGQANFVLKVAEHVSPDRVLQEVSNAINGLDRLPEEAKAPVVKIANIERHILSVMVYGTVPARHLDQAVQAIKKRFKQMAVVSHVDLVLPLSPEIRIEVSQDTLAKYQLSFSELAQIIQRAQVDAAIGTLALPNRDISLHAWQGRQQQEDFLSIPVIHDDTGAVILLKDIAVLSEGYRDEGLWQKFNGFPAVELLLYQAKNVSPNQAAQALHQSIAELNAFFAQQGISIKVVEDGSIVFKGRAELMLSNGLMGLCLVMLFLGLLMGVRLSFWVGLGIPIAFLGAFALCVLAGISLNLVSMFAFIISLGVVVDDAIVIGENIYAYRERGLSYIEAACQGVQEVAPVVVLSIVTNIIAFLPLMFVQGETSVIFLNIPVVVIAVLLISLLESTLILPAHLAHENPQGWQLPWPRVVQIFKYLQAKSSAGFICLRDVYYLPCLEWVLRHCGLTFAIAISALWINMGLLLGGHLGFEPLPDIEGDISYVSIVFREGTPWHQIQDVEKQVLAAAQSAAKALGLDPSNPLNVSSKLKEETLSVAAYLGEASQRNFEPSEFGQIWKQELGPLAQVGQVSFHENIGGSGSHTPTLTVELEHDDLNVLSMAAQQLVLALSRYPSVSEIDYGQIGAVEQPWNITPNAYAEALQLDEQTLLAQTQHAFQGQIVLNNLYRGDENIAVRLRLPGNERSSWQDLQRLVLQTKSGENVYLGQVAQFQPVWRDTNLVRRNGQRVKAVAMEVTPTTAERQLREALEEGIFKTLQAQYPSLIISYQGAQRELVRSIHSILIGLGVVSIVIYILLAATLNHFIHPLIVLLAVPFGGIGVILGHYIMQYALSISSLFGFLALAGILVNDSLVLVTFINQRRRTADLLTALREGARQRFRPIVLTSLTTCLGILPIMLETSIQARFLIPMVIALGFGVLIGTAVTLLLVPACYLLAEKATRGAPDTGAG